MRSAPHIIVVGGGITGVTSAYALSREGYRVTLLERHRYPAMETSFANGGQLSASNAEVWTHPGTLLKGLKWMFRSDAPLLLNPKPSWHKLSWFAGFLAATRSYREHTVATARLAVAAREHLFSWAEEEGIDFDVVKRGILHIYRDRASFDHAAEVTRLLAEGGLQRDAVSPEEMRAIEPTLAGDYYGGFYTESDSTGDIHKFTVALAAACERRGVKVLTGSEVVDVGSDRRNAWAELADGELVPADAMVICAGVQSRRLAGRFGDRLNVYPVKGYSITVQLADSASRTGAPTVSLLDDETKIVTSRLGDDRLRVAGTAEFNGYNRDIREDRIRPLIEWVNDCFPSVSTRQVVQWAGLRPMMPDMMPRVGPGRRGNIFYNTGHGHLGWTLSAITAHQLTGHVARWQGGRRSARVDVPHSRRLNAGS